jgi:RNA-splicing ligase RtcB
MLELKGKYNTAKVFTDVVEETAISQIVTLCNEEFSSGSTIRIMPDVHAGAGCTIGTTMTITDKVVPNLVGVDIGCGVLAVKLKQGTHIDLKMLDNIIKEYVPYGKNIREQEHKYARGIPFNNLKCKNKINMDRALKSVGTLGGGNHFIEANVDDVGCEYLVIHSGSRYFGKQIAEYYQELAYQELLRKRLNTKSIVDDLKSQGREKEIESALKILKLTTVKINKDLAYLEGDSFNDYLNDIDVAQEYAIANRYAIAEEILSHSGIAIGCVDYTFTSVHNYIDLDNMTLRKGAISAQDGEKLIIPINMRDGSLICVGKGNPDWNFSAPHGAGRIMSRSEAKKKISMDEYKKSMDGIYTTSVVESTLDEAPMAYKNKEDIINNIGDAVDIECIIKPIYNFKAGD